MAQFMEKQVINQCQNFSSKSGELGTSTSTSSDNESHGKEFLKKQPKKRRCSLPKEATHLLRSWLHKNMYSAYPSEDIKAKLAYDGNVSIIQVSNWFINARRRYVPILIEKAGGDPQLYKATRKSIHSVKRLGQDKQKQMPVQFKKNSGAVSSRAMKKCFDVSDGPHMFYNLRLLSTVACEYRDKIGVRSSN